MKQFLFCLIVMGLISGCSKEPLNPEDYPEADVMYVNVSLIDTLAASDSVHLILYDTSGYETVKMSLFLEDFDDFERKITGTYRYRTFWRGGLDEGSVYFKYSERESLETKSEFYLMTDSCENIHLTDADFYYTEDYKRVLSVQGMASADPSEYHITGVVQKFTIIPYY